AFDPASNIVEATERDVHGIGVLGGEPAVPLLDNLLKEYAGTHNTYDEQGNLKERRRNGERMVFGWSSLGRMVTASDRHMQARYVYDALGRRIAKLTEPQVPHLSSAGSGWRDAKRRRLKQEHGYGLTLYGWDGDTLAYETSWDKRETTHYVYEPGGFTPLVRATGAAVLRDDGDAVAELTSIAYYHCDPIGTPQEVTDEAGEIAWSARYKAWGEAREVIGEAARKAGIVNPLRFAGQYFDRETGLHYNRYRYYDPGSGRFISKDPIGLAGGVNVFQYASNPTGWIDPLGLSKRCPTMTNPRRLQSRQGPSEMTGNKVKRYASAMRAQGGFGTFPPIEAADVGEGKLVIIDGHHRAEAAMKAGVPEVPVNVTTVSPEEAAQLKDEADMAKAERMSRCQY
ncbi:RHS repeat-associated core domain-containing protein, partial [Burkholderia stagnalis]|uniref:RHS repeat-associated core domain-containing protein n=2 Tax=Burkholderia stagnalis TaxID=1503054 RepID=UPI000A773456